jgi:hypothetical protein
MRQSTSTLGLWVKLALKVKMKWDMLKNIYLCLNFFDKTNGNMVKTYDKHDAFKLKSKDYVIDKQDHELPTCTITNVLPVLTKASQPIVLEI